LEGGDQGLFQSSIQDSPGKLQKPMMYLSQQSITQPKFKLCTSQTNI